MSTSTWVLIGVGAFVLYELTRPAPYKTGSAPVPVAQPPSTSPGARVGSDVANFAGTYGADACKQAYPDSADLCTAGGKTATDAISWIWNAL